MAEQTLSVIVVSRHRPEALVLCLKALQLQDYPLIELIVVADPQGLAAIKPLGLAIKTALFDEANISAARNIGIDLAAGDCVAFIDDDAIAEPTWARRLAGAIAEPEVVASTGFVRGRNGISYQWKASEIDSEGRDHALSVDQVHPTILRGTAARTVKTQGTNCAFQTAALRAIGGFDPAFRFFLDEADVNLRMAHLGATAIVPLAQVQHGYLGSDRRRPDRVPTSLFEIGASSAVFARRHSPDRIASARDRLLAAQNARAIGHMISGHIEPRDVARLMKSLVDGWAEGVMRPAPLPAPRSQLAPDFTPLTGLRLREGHLIAGRSWNRSALDQSARRAAQDGGIVTLLCLAPGWRRHRHWFHPAGYWVQEGGLWGRSKRDQRPPMVATLAQRTTDERARLAGYRPI